MATKRKEKTRKKRYHPTNHHVGITNHAKERYEERFGDTDNLESKAEKAFNEGISVKSTHGLFRKYMESKISHAVRDYGTNSAIFKIYDNAIFIFGKESGELNLVTVYPIPDHFLDDVKKIKEDKDQYRIATRYSATQIIAGFPGVGKRTLMRNRNDYFDRTFKMKYICYYDFLSNPTFSSDPIGFYIESVLEEYRKSYYDIILMDTVGLNILMRRATLDISIRDLRICYVYPRIGDREAWDANQRINDTHCYSYLLQYPGDWYNAVSGDRIARNYNSTVYRLTPNEYLSDKILDIYKTENNKVSMNVKDTIRIIDSSYTEDILINADRTDLIKLLAQYCYQKKHARTKMSQDLIQYLSDPIKRQAFEKFYELYNSCIGMFSSYKSVMSQIGDSVTIIDDKNKKRCEIRYPFELISAVANILTIDDIEYDPSRRGYE